VPRPPTPANAIRSFLLARTGTLHRGTASAETAHRPARETRNLSRRTTGSKRRGTGPGRARQKISLLVFMVYSFCRAARALK
jgi:hypothetical protein